MTLIFDEARHRYTLDGKPVPGVTTIIGKGLPKPTLPYWAAKVVANQAVADRQRLALDARPDDVIARELARAPWKERDKAAMRGTQVHALAEALAKDESVEVPPQVAPLVQAYADFLDDAQLTPMLVEARVGSRSHWYAGTLDLIGDINGQTWGLDLKTSRSVYGSYALQIAAYINADFYLDPDGAECPLPQVDRIGVVHLTEQGAALHEYLSIPKAWEAFQAVKAVADHVPLIDSWDMKK